MEKRCTNCDKFPFCPEIPKKDCEKWIKMGLRSVKIKNERRNMERYKRIFRKISNWF